MSPSPLSAGARGVARSTITVGRWVDDENLQRPHQPSFVECNGAAFEEYGNRRTWFVLWENGLAILSVLSAVSRLSSSACTPVQIVGAALQMCGLPVLVVARPHHEAKALLLAAAVEAFGFVGGLCLLVSATTSIDDDPRGDAASVALQIQLYAGVALLILDGLHTGRIQDALRRFVAAVNPSSSFEADVFRRRQPIGVHLQHANNPRPKRSSNTTSPSLSSNINRSRCKNTKEQHPIRATTRHNVDGVGRDDLLSSHSLIVLTCSMIKHQ